MGKIPTEQMKKAYHELINTDKDIVKFGKNKEHVLVYEYNVNYDEEKIYYLHYGVIVGIIKYNKAKDEYEIKLTNNGYSNTDRDNFNGLLYCEELYDRFKCYRRNESLFLSIDNVKYGCWYVGYNPTTSDITIFN